MTKLSLLFFWAGYAAGIATVLGYDLALLAIVCFASSLACVFLQDVVE